MSFHDIRLPLWLSNQFQVNLISETLIVKTNNGQEYRRCNQNYNLKNFEVKNLLINNEQYRELVDFYNRCFGKTYSFKFKDSHSFSTNGQFIAVGDNSTTSFELFLLIDNQLNITKKVLINEDTIKIEINHVVTDFDYDKLTNMISLAFPLRDYETLRATFEYDLKVRFDTNNLNYIRQINGCIEIEELKIKEVMI